MVVEAAGQQGGFQEQIHLLVGLIAEPLQRLQLLLQGSGGGGIHLSRFAGQGGLAGKEGRLRSTAVVGLHDPAIDPMGRIEVPAPSS